MEAKRDSWKKPVGILFALLLVAAIVGAAVVNKDKFNAPMEVDGLTAEMADAVSPLVTGDTAAVPKTDEIVTEEPDDDSEYVIDDSAEAAPKDENEEVETVLAKDGMKDGDFEDEIVEAGADDDLTKVAEDSSRWVYCRKRCRRIRYRVRVKAGDRNNDDRDDFRYVYRYRVRCSCPRGGRKFCARRCQRRCYHRWVNVCRRVRVHRWRWATRRVRHSSDDYVTRRYRHYYWVRVRQCRRQRRRICHTRCRRQCRCKCLRRGSSD